MLSKTPAQAAKAGRAARGHASSSTSPTALLSEMGAIEHLLARCPHLAPADDVDGLLTRLVDLCIAPYSADFAERFFAADAATALCRSLRSLCATAEAELERHWVARMLDAAAASEDTSPAQPTSLLAAFPYYDNYRALARLESSLLATFLPAPPRTIAFLGSGPLPLTSFCLLDAFPHALVHNVDRDAAAVQASRRLATSLGHAVRMAFTCEDVGALRDAPAAPWTRSDVVFLAALVGLDAQSKLAVLASLATRLPPGTLVVARSARGLRTLLYPVLELSEELRALGYDVLLEAHPWTSVVNSVVVLRVKERQ